MSNNRYDYINSYKKEHYKRFTLELPRDFFDDTLAPAASLKGLSVSAFIKEAINEKLDREKSNYANK